MNVYKAIVEASTDDVSNIINQFNKGDIGYRTAYAKLMSSGLNPDEIQEKIGPDEYGRANPFERDDYPWEVLKPYKAGLMSKFQAKKELLDMGYDDIDIDVYLNRVDLIEGERTRLGITKDELINKLSSNTFMLEESYDNGTWMKYQNEIESILEKAHDSMEEDAFMDFCTGVINLCQNYMGDLDQYDGYLESEFTTPCIDDGSELAKEYGLTVKSKEKTSDTSTPYVCKFTGPKESIVKMIKEKFNSGDDSVTEEIIKEIKDSENETKECDTLMKESNYDESIFTSIENALTDSGLDVTRYTDAGMMTKNIGWVVSNSEGEVNLTCDGTYLDEGDHHSKECNCKECQLSRLNERVESLKERCNKDKLLETKDSKEE